MPLFFFVSGFLSAKLFEQTPRSFILNNMITIVVPYIIWSWIFLTLNIAFPNNVNIHYSASSFFEIFVPWRPIGVYWFLYVLLIARIIYFLAGRQSRTVVVIVFVAFSFAYLLSEAFLIGSEDMSGLSATLVRLCRAGTFVGFRLIAATRDAVKETILSPKHLPLWAVGWMGAAALILYSPAFEVLRFATGFLGTALTLSLARQIELKSTYRPQFLSDVGKATIAIFVAHVIFASVMRSILHKIGVHSAFPYVVLGTTAGVVFPMIMFYVANYLRIAPQVGFGKNVAVFVGRLNPFMPG